MRVRARVRVRARGGVGCGKTMCMDMFFDCCEVGEGEGELDENES